mmetsp:Transcript_8936/g.16381  ORF Transcript_8936/g.16381 Transcript_8936/m.16381 type:complete len:220 (+) Transcript_8936:807-1466(+)
MTRDSTFDMMPASDVRAVASINPITPRGPAAILPEFISSINLMGSTIPSLAFAAPPSMIFAHRPVRTVSYLSLGLRDEKATFKRRSLSLAKIISPLSMAEFGVWHSDEYRRGADVCIDIFLCPSAEVGQRVPRGRLTVDTDDVAVENGATNAIARCGLHNIEPAMINIPATTCCGLRLLALSYTPAAILFELQLVDGHGDRGLLSLHDMEHGAIEVAVC